MFIVQRLQTKEEALRIIDFFFSEQAFRHEWAPGEKNIVKRSVLTSLKNQASHPYWFIENAEKIIGALGVKENAYKSGGYEMTDDYFAVHEDFRKQGLGRSLFAAMEAFVLERNGRYIHIETCDIPYYEPARKFYEKNGYKQVGEMPDYFNVGEGRIDYFKKIREVT